MQYFPQIHLQQPAWRKVNITLIQRDYLNRLSTGAIRLSLMSGAAIIPVGFHVPLQHLRNFSLQKKDRLARGLWQTGGHCYIQIGSPWLPGQELSGKADDTALHELTARLMERIEALAHLAALECGREKEIPFPGVSSYG